MGKKRPSRRLERRKAVGVRKGLSKEEAAPSAPAPALDRPEWLPSDWKMEVRKRRDGVRGDRYYICPISGNSLRSKPEVMRYLSFNREKKVEASKCRASKFPDSGEWHSSMAGHGSDYSKQLLAALEDNLLEWLPPGWILELGTCMNGVSANNYTCYFNILTGSRFYSKEEVLRFLEAHKLSGLTSTTEGSANATDFHSSSEKGNTHMECTHNVLAEIDCFPSELPHGWIKEIRITKTRTSQQIRRDPYYIDMVSGFGFRSKRDAFRHLENKEACKFAFRLKKSHLPKLCSLMKDATKLTMVKKENDDNNAKREHLSWTFQTDEAFVQSMLTQHYAGNRVEGTFTSTAYANMVNELTTKLGISFTKNHLKNRLKTIKEHFRLSYDMYRGVKFCEFAWNSETKMFETTEEVWQTLIEANPDYANWRTKKVHNFQDLMELFGKDRDMATCDVAQTAKERNNWMSNTCNIKVETIDEVDQLLSTNEVTLENFDDDDDDVQMISPMEAPQVSTQKVSSSESKKRKHDEIDISLKLMGSLDNVAEAIREGNIILERSCQRVYTEEEIWSELEVIGLESSSAIRGAYLFLVNHPEKVRALFGCPLQMRKSILEDMMHESG